MGRIVRGWATQSDKEEGQGARCVSKDRLNEHEVLIEGELDPMGLVGSLFYIAPGWRRVYEDDVKSWQPFEEVASAATVRSGTFRLKPDFTGLRNFMAGCAEAGTKASRDYELYVGRQRDGEALALRGLQGYRMNANTKAHASAEWTRRVSEKVKQLEQERRNDVPWDPYAY